LHLKSWDNLTSFITFLTVTVTTKEMYKMYRSSKPITINLLIRKAWRLLGASIGAIAILTLSTISQAKNVEHTKYIALDGNSGILSNDDELPIGGTRVDDVSNNYRELFNLEHEITPYTSKLFGEQVGLSTGSISFTHTDVSITGDSKLPVNITRVFVGTDSIDSNTRDFGSWGINLPHIRSNIMTLDGEMSFKGSWASGNACSGTLGDGGNWDPYVDSNLLPERGQSIWNGDNISIPGYGSQKILSKVENNNEKRTTNEQWKISCITATDGYEGFVVTTNYGSKYTFSKLRLVKGKKFRINTTYTRFNKKSPSFRTYHAFMLPTRVEDKFGNTVTYSYGKQSRLEKIKASDGREISLTYYESHIPNESAFQNLVKTVSTNNRTWTYQYESKGNALGFGNINVLSTVTRPDLKNWHFDHPNTTLWRNAFSGFHSLTVAPGEGDNNIRNCDGNPNSGTFVTITHPDGLIADFNYQKKKLVRFDMPWEWASANYTAKWSPSTWPKYRPCSMAYSLTSKVITHIDNSKKTWTYTYRQPVHGYFSAASGNTPYSSTYHEGINLPTLPYGLKSHDLRTTEITAPDGSKISHHFSGKWGWTENQEILTDYFDKDGSTLLRRVKNTFSQGPARGSSKVKDDFTSLAFLRTIETNNSYKYSNGTDQFKTVYSAFNNYDVATKVAETGGTHHRYTTKTFVHDLTNWVLNMPSQTKVGSTSATNVQSQQSKTEYSTFIGTGSVLLPHKLYGPSALISEIKSYHNTGLVNEVRFNSPMKQGQTGNTYQKMTNYKLGQATEVILPKRYTSGEMKMSRIVDDNGWVTSVTNLNGNTTSYSYDGLGRLQSVDFPLSSIKDSVYLWGKSLGYPVRTEKRCALNTTKTDCATTPLLTAETTYDGYLRPIKVKTTDNTTNVSQYQNFTYNIDNQQTKQSYISYSDGVTNGITTIYDGLQRKISSNMYGGGTVTTSYLAGNKVLVSDALYNDTTTTYQAFNGPTYNTPLNIESPENITTTSVVNVFGNITSITQSGFNGNIAISQTEYRAYDSQRNLCQISRDDVGTTVMNRNSVGEIQWQAQGQIAANKSVCNTSAITANKIMLSYDNLGNQHNISFGDGTATKIFGLDNNGNVKTLSYGGVVQNYNYNSNDLLEDETLKVAGKALKLDYTYDTLGNLSKLKYPSGREVNYLPNAFGQATKASIYAKNALYHPSGMIKSFTYGNDLTYEKKLDLSQRPYEIKVKKSGTNRLFQRYLYDNNNNIDYLYDFMNRSYDIDMSYDDVDRLTYASGKWGNGTINYDGLGNIKSKAVGSFSLTYHYDSKNRLDSTTGSKIYDFQYDARGNVRNNGSYGLIFNRANQLTNAKGNSYIYDGYDRLVKKVTPNKTVYSMYSVDGTLYYREEGNKKIDYIRLGNELIAKDDSTSAPPNSYIQLTVPPNNLNGFATTCSSFPTNCVVKASWQYNMPNQVEYYELYSKNGSFTSCPPFEKCFSPTVSSFNIGIIPSGDWIKVYSGNGTNASINTDKNTVTVKVRACNLKGCSPYSSEKTINVDDSI
jgi:YD repeat-containing protein